MSDEFPNPNDVFPNPPPVPYPLHYSQQPPRQPGFIAPPPPPDPWWKRKWVWIPVAAFVALFALGVAVGDEPVAEVEVTIDVDPTTTTDPPTTVTTQAPTTVTTQAPTTVTTQAPTTVTTQAPTTETEIDISPDLLLNLVMQYAVQDQGPEVFEDFCIGGAVLGEDFERDTIVMVFGEQYDVELYAPWTEKEFTDAVFEWFNTECGWGF